MKYLGKSAKTPQTVTLSTKNYLIIFFTFYTDCSYEKLLALFVGSYFVNALDQVMPRVTDADMLNTKDNLGEY